MSERGMRGLRRSLVLGLLGLAAVAMAGTAAPAAESEGASATPSGPLTLDECALIALHNSPQIISAAQSVTSARAALTGATSAYYPQIAVSASEAVAGTGASSSGGVERTEEADLSLRQTLWRSGLRESVEESAARLRSAELTYLTAVQGLVQQVASDYYATLAAERLTQVAEVGVEAAKGHLAQVQARIQLGATPEVDKFTAEADLARAELDLIDAQTNHKVALARVKTTMGVPVETSLELATPSPVGQALSPEAELPALPQALETARARRPEILGAREVVAASRSALRQAEIQRGPATEVGGRYNAGLTDWESHGSTWDLSLTLSWPLFDGNATAAQVTSARASRLRAEADLQRTINEAGLDVESALARAERASARITVTARSVAAAEARLRAAEGKYQEGVGILLEVTDARTAYSSALADQIQAEYDYRTALIAVQKALGTLAPPQAEEK